MKTIDQFPAACRMAAAVQITLTKFGIDPDHLLVDFGPTATSQMLHAMVVIVDDKHEAVLGIVNCGPATETPGEDQREACEAAWNEFAEVWNTLPATAREKLWRAGQPAQSIADIGAALASSGIVTPATVDVRVVEMTTAPGPEVA